MVNITLNLCNERAAHTQAKSVLGLIELSVLNSNFALKLKQKTKQKESNASGVWIISPSNSNLIKNLGVKV